MKEVWISNGVGKELLSLSGARAKDPRFPLGVESWATQFPEFE